MGMRFSIQNCNTIGPVHFWRMVMKRHAFRFVCFLGFGAVVICLYSAIRTEQWPDLSKLRFSYADPPLKLFTVQPFVKFNDNLAKPNVSRTMVHSGKGKTRKSSIYAGNDTSLPRNANANINFSFKVLTNPEILSQTADATFTSKVNGKVKVIIILAYMHTGSTYLGDVLHQLPGSFYEYEPLRSLQQASRYRDAITFMNGSRKQLQRGKAVAYQLAAKAVEHMVTCNHRNLDYGTLLHAFRSIS
ncbi:hypothetical protein MAR_024278, partial [Mya arenaria]